MAFLRNTGFRKISTGFMVIISIALLNVIISAYVVQRNKKTAIRITNQINPYIESLEEFNRILTENKMYTTNWVYLPNNNDDKHSLEKIHSTYYPRIKQKLISQLEKLGKRAEADSLSYIFRRFELLMLSETRIMTTLVTFDNYENPTIKFSAEELIESTILPETQVIQQRLKKIISENRAYATHMKDDMISSFNTLMSVMLITSVLLLSIVLLTSAYIGRAIRRPILAMKDIILRMGKGELPKERLAVAEDVVGEMVSAVNILSESFSKTSMFASEIGSGNLSAEFKRLGENDMLGNALINMRNSLQAYSENMEHKVAARTRELLEKSEKLEMAYGEIRDSISYAKRIQEAILPSFDLMREVLPESFVFYKPKDIVCGDFYWYAHKGDELIVAAVDCTGHGVPGALMTVIGNSLLNQIVNIAGIIDPADILQQLDRRLLETLQQHGTVDTNDGMDVALCRYNRNTGELVFAGAKRPLYVFRRSGLKEIKGDKFPIGSFQYDGGKVFTEYRINVSPGDTIYLFSDGYQDQFGGISGKKFMTGQFRDLLKDIHHTPMQQQHETLEKVITEWQGDCEQTDDMLLIGIRF